MTGTSRRTKRAWILAAVVAAQLAGAASVRADLLPIFPPPPQPPAPTPTPAPSPGPQVEPGTLSVDRRIMSSTFGGQVTLTGILVGHGGGNAGHRLVLQQDEWPFDGWDPTADSAYTDSGGHFRITPYAHLQFNTKYRLVVDEHPATASDVVLVYVSPSLRFTAHRSGAHRVRLVVAIAGPNAYLGNQGYHHGGPILRPRVQARSVYFYARGRSAAFRRIAIGRLHTIGGSQLDLGVERLVPLTRFLRRAVRLVLCLRYSPIEGTGAPGRTPYCGRRVLPRAIQ